MPLDNPPDVWTAPPHPSSRPLFDLAVLWLVASKRLKTWLAIAGVIWMATIVACLCLAPRNYASTASIAVQQTANQGGMLSMLSGLGTVSKTYLGIVDSLRFARAAAAAAGIRQIYGLKSDDDAAWLVQKGVTLDDRADGLIYITVRLPAPPRVSFGGASANRIRHAARDLASDYVAEFSNYLDTTNTDRNAALVREASQQLAAARASYDESLQDLAAYVRSLPAGQGAGSSGDSSVSLDAGKSAGILTSLYQTKMELENRIALERTETEGESQLAASSPQALALLPAEDPLLAEARRQVAEATAEVDSLKISLSDDNPDVVAARQKLANAEAQLAAESLAIRQGRTSDSVRNHADEAQLAVVNHQIETAEQSMVADRSAAIELEKRRNETALRLEILKATAQQYADLSVQRLSGNNLMDIVDTPLVPVSPTPGLGVLIALSFFVALLALQLGMAAEYARAWFRQNSAEIRTALHVHDMAA